RVADEFFLCSLVRCVKDKGPGWVIVGGRRLYAPDIRSVTGFGHSETSRQRERAHVAQISAMVFLRPEKIDTHTEKSELYTELHHEAEVVVTQRLHDGEVRGHVPGAAIFLGIANRPESLIGQQTTPRQHFIAVDR